MFVYFLGQMLRIFVKKCTEVPGLNKGLSSMPEFRMKNLRLNDALLIISWIAIRVILIPSSYLVLFIS